MHVNNRISKSKKISIDSVLISCSVILAFLGNYTLPFITFFKLDFSDIASFLATLLFGGSHGILVLFVTSVIRMFTGDVFTLNTFISRMSSSVVIFFLSIYYKYNKNYIILSAISVILLILVRIPLLYDLWINYFSVPKEIFLSKMFPCIMIMMFIRTLITLVISKLLYNNLSNKLKNID